MEKTKKSNSLVISIFIAMILAIVVGLCFQEDSFLVKNGIVSHDFTELYIKPFGTIFINLIKMIVVPLVLLSIIQGITSMKDIKKVGKIGFRILVFYFVTTIFAITIGLIMSNIFDAAGGFVLQGDVSYTKTEAPSFMQTLVNIFPSNFITPMSSSNMLQIIVIALFFGAGIIVAEEKGEALNKVINSGADVTVCIMEFIITLSPLGVFCLLTPVVAVNGAKVLAPLLRVILIAYLAYIIHAGIVYSFIAKVFAKISPIKFFKGIAPAMAFSFASASSVGTLPINLKCTEDLGAKREVAAFTLPLGATINMDGTAIYQGVCAIFIASVYGINLNLSQQLTIILTATLASIGTAGVPGSGMIMLAMVLESVGLPVEGIALVAGIDRIFDMGRTTLNITGDAACTLAVSKMTD